MVKTWVRFWLFALTMTGLIAGVVYVAAFEGWRPALGMALFLTICQLMFLYAMRRMYLEITGFRKSGKPPSV